MRTFLPLAALAWSSTASAQVLETEPIVISEATLTCRSDRDCSEEGLCSPDGARGCVASGRDCVGTEACIREGLCTAAGVCIATGRDCERSQVCLGDGLCHASDGICVAASAAACQRSTRCREVGKCELDPEERHCDGGERHSTDQFAGGMVLIGLGSAAFLTASYLALSLIWNDGESDHLGPPALALGIGGPVVALAGMGLAISGGRTVSRHAPHTWLRVGPSSLHVGGSF